MVSFLLLNDSSDFLDVLFAIVENGDPTEDLLCSLLLVVVH